MYITQAGEHACALTLKCSENQGEIERYIVDLGMKINSAA